jgi:hypothetical protein
VSVSIEEKEMRVLAIALALKDKRKEV